MASSPPGNSRVADRLLPASQSGARARTSTPTPRAVPAAAVPGKASSNSQERAQPKGVYQETKTSSELRNGSGKQGLCGACCCSLLGLFVYVGALGGIAVNEVQTVCVSKAAEYARQEYEEVLCTAQGLPDHGRPLHFACPISARSLQTFSPHDFDGAHWLQGAFAVKDVKVSQHVSMFQCVEDENVNNDDKVTFVTWDYSLQWKDIHIDDKKFKAWQNPDAWQALAQGCGSGFRGNPPFSMRSQDLSTDSLYAGAYDVTRHLGMVSVDSDVQLKQGRYNLPPQMTVSGGRRIAKDGNAYTRSQFVEHYGEDRGAQEWEACRQVQGESPVQVLGNTVQTCSGEPVLGCFRASYRQAAISHVSLLAGRDGEFKNGATKAWVAPSSWMCPSSSSANQVDLFGEDKLSADELVDNAQSNNTARNLAIRVVCFILAIVGVYSFLQPIQAAAHMTEQLVGQFRFIPILGSIMSYLGHALSGAVGIVIILISIGIGAPSALAVMSISWVLVHPMVAVPGLIACAVLYSIAVWAVTKFTKFGAIGKVKKRREEEKSKTP